MGKWGGYPPTLYIRVWDSKFSQFLLEIFFYQTVYQTTKEVVIVFLVIDFKGSVLQKLAEEVRFELTVGMNPRRFSRPVH